MFLGSNTQAVPLEPQLRWGAPGNEVQDRDDNTLRLLVQKLDKIEAFIKTRHMRGAQAVLPKRARKGLEGFCVSVGHDPKVGFDRDAKRALPKCPRCPMAGDGHKYNAWADCRLGGKQQPASSAAAYCQPVEEYTAEVLHTLAVC
ncbi:hypothetical protein CYMTET_12612 [Cymbomonas tetramitiformis]|uniref:Uncharacterized protein n=1 Tax=Cymbomonas tetramitiformis TaxID=36881 RepID=A0AAE0GJZ5_9CHLO|nr:hypothetical protein CYMTET_12612 [Cymbomonas tetramitiformis]